MYTPTEGLRQRVCRRLVIVPVAASALLCGCITYTPQEVGTLSGYDLCEAQHYSRINLTAETRARVSEEIARRREDCSRQAAAIEADRERETERHMYENSGP